MRGGHGELSTHGQRRIIGLLGETRIRTIKAWILANPTMTVRKTAYALDIPRLHVEAAISVLTARGELDFQEGAPILAN